MNNLRRKDHRGAVDFHGPGHHHGPTVRHRTVQAVSIPPTTLASIALSTSKTTASPRLMSFDFFQQPIQSIHSDFNIDCYRSASPARLDLGLEPCTNWAGESDMREMSTISTISADTSSTGSIFSSVPTEFSDAMTVRNGRGRSRGPSPLSRGGRTNSTDNSTPSFVCLGPQCQRAFSSDKDLKSHVKSCHTYLCNWAGCDQPSFSTRDGLIYHVKVKHLVICPSPGCTETTFQSIRLLQSHIAMAHPEDGRDDAKEWELPAKINTSMETGNRSSSSGTPTTTLASLKRKNRDHDTDMSMDVVKTKHQCQDRLQAVVEKRARKNAGTPRSAESPTDLIRGRASRHIAFTQGEINRTVTWARGLGKDHKDDICAARNPYFFRDPCMGDSIGVTGNGVFEDSTATLGPCITVGGGSYWLGNFHPFMEAYQQLAQVEVEHPSSQDRKRCIDEGHDAMAQETNFRLGKLEVTSGLNLKTTRISHDPYWDECDMDKPLVVTDWALIGARTSQANILRKFPSETQPPTQEPTVATTTAIVPGADVLSSGRTSGYQRGQICEIPAYVSGVENQTQKATREWFIEEPWPQEDEDAWIRGGIGVNGDSGAGVVDANTHGLIGQVWGRNNYWGPGQRVTYFTPIADIFDDIQEKCGQQSRPQLPQHRDEANCFPLHPSCRQCFDLRVYLNSSRRSSRMSLQSMIMGTGDGDQDLTSIEAVSELATPKDYHRYSGIEETLASLSGIVSPAGPSGYPGTPMIADMKSPYATELDLGDLCCAGFR
ncbi:hypothetical protein BFJ68_g15601 [Fusarium oxysporum]|uniref:C2H2-type domain-containing protein n=1 Tax=Fusarium oxysporum TaxID=5507 RepID=A0A420PL73_FUSOX|nr:hypothetical protein BFJ68_g15601 [Fusarium oxysporum]